jgi:hypothetical protein
LSYTDFLAGEPAWIYLLCINEDYEKHLKLDLPRISLLIKQYLNIVEPTTVGDELFDNPIYGQKTFRSMAELINNVHLNNRYCDSRFTLMFYEHKQVMLKRMQYLQSMLEVY